MDRSIPGSSIESMYPSKELSRCGSFLGFNLRAPSSCRETLEHQRSLPAAGLPDLLTVHGSISGKRSDLKRGKRMGCCPRKGKESSRDGNGKERGWGCCSTPTLGSELERGKRGCCPEWESENIGWDNSISRLPHGGQNPARDCAKFVLKSTQKDRNR